MVCLLKSIHSIIVALCIYTKIGYVHGIPYNGMSIEVDTFHYCCIMYTMNGYVHGIPYNGMSIEVDTFYY